MQANLSKEMIETVYNALIHIQMTASQNTVSHLGNVLDAVDLFGDLLSNAQEAQ
jgi:hypothetical protein